MLTLGGKKALAGGSCQKSMTATAVSGPIPLSALPLRRLAMWSNKGMLWIFVLHMDSSALLRLPRRVRVLHQQTGVQRLASCIPYGTNPVAYLSNHTEIALDDGFMLSSCNNAHVFLTGARQPKADQLYRLLSSLTPMLQVWQSVAQSWLPTV